MLTYQVKETNNISNLTVMFYDRLLVLIISLILQLLNPMRYKNGDINT
ncbi:hypothetical protein HMPREF0072_1892 [Anaerococcus lactolyticus ATCC 51172]|uniref:Uncharacterized protein n=1 Tax=Anaerococcus lactolyticus ATCC 51172 TaxID=525254 RepID=C2BHS2_9FIRM|nr:hypothetical protein HMPREF0072_1892 [Anaerococcus lactolyticus ATCC 51172]